MSPEDKNLVAIYERELLDRELRKECEIYERMARTCKNQRFVPWRVQKTAVEKKLRKKYGIKFI
jgi:hypothetical protein